MKTGKISIRTSELRMRKRNRALSLILELSNLLSASLKLPSLLEGALSLVLEHFQLDAGRIYLLNINEQFLSLAACRGMNAAGLERINLSEGFSGEAVRTKSFIAQYVSELEDRERSAFLSGLGLLVVICVPLIVRDEILGVMNLASRQAFELDQDEIDLLVAVGNQIAIAANQAILYEDLEKEQKKTEFLTYSVSHDLRSPAVGAFGLSQLLERQFGSALGEKGKTYCEQIRKSAGQILLLVDDMKAYITEKESSLHAEQFDVKDLVESIGSEFAHVFSERLIEWVQPSTGMAIKADRLLISRALQNLVDNALKYGGNTVTRISVYWREEQDAWVLCVADNGIGIGDADPESLFQIFCRGTSSKGVSGTGLGLAIVKEAAQRHNGRAWVEAGEAHGVKFCFSVSKHLNEQNHCRRPKCGQ